MAIINGGRVIEGTLGVARLNAGIPVSGNDEIDTLTFGGTITGGTFVLIVDGFPTAPITWSATNATLVANIDAALEALPSVGVGGVTTAVGTMTAGIGTITVTFNGNNGRRDVPAMDFTSALTGAGASLAVATTTAGVNATARGSATGALLIDITNGGLYQNTSTTLNAPTWSYLRPIVQQTAITDLAGGADLPTTVAKVNALLAALRSAGVIAP